MLLCRRCTMRFSRICECYSKKHPVAGLQQDVFLWSGWFAFKKPFLDILVEPNLKDCGLLNKSLW